MLLNQSQRLKISVRTVGEHWRDAPQRLPARACRATWWGAVLWACGAGLCWSHSAPAAPNATQPAASAKPTWIWSPEHRPQDVPQEACYFRKTLHLHEPQQGTIEIAADDEYELSVNGKEVGTGAGWRDMESHDISARLRDGRNVIAVKVQNRNGTAAGLAASIRIQLSEGEQRNFVSDATWRTSLRVLPLWTTLTYRDRRWKAAQSLGPFGATPPWIEKQSDPKPQLAQSKEKTAATQKMRIKLKPRKKTEDVPRFNVPEGFQVQLVAQHEDTGSLLAMAFNEFGQIIASQEGGPLLMIYDSNDNDTPDAVQICCTKVRNCQGILAVSGRLYVTGDGPSGTALYRLDDNDRDGKYEEASALVKFKNSMGEHGPHGLALGPDGMIYCALGNHTRLNEPYDLSSPHRDYYEGALISPKYEDPRGRAAGIQPPGGAILRIDLEGRRVELFAGGIRNAHDLAFNPDGELFAHDSDMEGDLGTSWHRPTRLLHVIAGGEFGWRSGWSKWPEYFLDTLPSILDTGQGSPTGCVFYTHVRYPEEFRNVLYSGDWSGGEIVAFRLQRRASGYAAQRQTLLRGEPLNVSDLDVGPDGWLYFSTGGRGTKGSVYRVVWNQSQTPSPQRFASVAEAVGHPQVDSAWGRQQISTCRRDEQSQWDRDIRAFLADRRQSDVSRARALGFMHLVGPPPADVELAEWSQDASPIVRGRAALLMGLIRNDVTGKQLTRLLSDPDPSVRRCACESLVRTGRQVPLQTLGPLLSSPDRFEAWAARRLLERVDPNNWQDEVLVSDDLRLFIQGATALMIAAPSKEAGLRIIRRFGEQTDQYVSDADFVDLLRVVQLALLRGNIQPDDVPELGPELAPEFPAGDARLNRELTRLLVYLQEARAVDRMLAYLRSNVPSEEKVHVAMHLRFLQRGWTPRQKLALLEYFEAARHIQGGSNLKNYLDRAAEDFIAELSPSERALVLDAAPKLPAMALKILFVMPESTDAENFDRYRRIDERMVDRQGVDVERLKTGLIAVIARGGSDEGMEYLRKAYERDPERRQEIAMGLAQKPEGRNWDYLIRSIPLLEGEPAREVLTKLRDVPFAPDSPEHYRQVILSGLRLKDKGGMDAHAVLEHWVGQTPPGATKDWKTALTAWQKWFDETYPERPMAKLPQETGSNTWTYDDLITYLESQESRQGSAERGAEVFRQARCARCHVHGSLGESFGPDLSTVAKRFQRREILESIIYPSQVISDQYAANQVVTSDGRAFWDC